MKSLLQMFKRPEVGSYLPNNFQIQIGDVINYGENNSWVVCEIRDKYYICYNPAYSSKTMQFNYMDLNKYYKLVKYDGQVEVTEEDIKAAKEYVDI